MPNIRLSGYLLPTSGISRSDSSADTGGNPPIIVISMFSITTSLIKLPEIPQIEEVWA
jgi:hypothetical protein